MSNSIAANDIIQNIDDLLAEYPVDECISILQEVVKEMDVRIKEYIINKILPYHIIQNLSQGVNSFSERRSLCIEIAVGKNINIHITPIPVI